MPEPQSTLSLWEELPYEKTVTTKTEAQVKQEALWLAVCLPKLALEVVDNEKQVKAVVVEESKGKRIIHTASCVAEKLGIFKSMSLSAAYAIEPDLTVYELDKVAQKTRLEALAKWAIQFSPKINLHPPCSFLLEVQGSIKYFGSLAAIQEKITQGLNEQWHHTFYQATTPTPAASLMLAESGRNVIVKRSTELRSTLGQLTVNSLPIDNKRKQQLNKTGVQVLRDLWRLPKEGLARRFGTDLVSYLDRALGKQKDPLVTYKVPPRFSESYEFNFAVNDYQFLLPAAYELLSNLCDFLRRNDLYTSLYHLQLFHEQQPATLISIGLRQATRQANDLILLLETKITESELIAPVVSMKLIANKLHSYTSQTASFLPGINSKYEQNEIDGLLEQLHARLGYDKIKSIVNYDDHRPEYAYCHNPYSSSTSIKLINPRPLWLLASPRQLLKKNDGIYYKGPIKFISGPERIESGWWDDNNINRDYYIARDKLAGRLWVYRELVKNREWYLHGLFS